MKKACAIFSLLFFISFSQAEPLALVPQPLKVEKKNGSLLLEGIPNIQTDNVALEAQKQILAGFIRESITSQKTSQVKVSLTIDKSLELEEYFLTIDDSISLRGGSPTAIYYASVTLSQLLPAQSTKQFLLPKVSIHDKPQFSYRGTMVDVSRHFIQFAEMKKYIDIISRHKMNVLQLHLTDNEGWRLEIDAYPELTKEGSVRGSKHKLKPFRHRSSSKKQLVDADPYGPFFYTKKQIRELIAYAQVRGVEIIPEIDLPGHSKAAAATLGIACNTDKSDTGLHGYAGNVWCASREENFVMIETILKEVAELFPSDYIHFGGDEVNVKQWPKCPKCRNMMEAKGLHNGHEVQNYFVKRITDIITKIDKKPIGWNEILHGGKLPEDTVVMSWIGTGPGINAAKKGYDVIMAPGQYLYFDMKESSNPNELGHWWAGIVDLEKAFSYQPLDGIPNQFHKNIKGISCALWTEFVSPEKIQLWYKSFPRLCATAEVAWRPSAAATESKSSPYNYQSFMQRMANGHLNRLDAWGIPYRIPRAQAWRYENGSVEIVPPTKEFSVRYTNDGSEPTPESTLYKPGQLLKNSNKLKYATFAPSGRQSSYANWEILRKPASFWTTNAKEIRIPLGEFSNKGGFYEVLLSKKSGAELKLKGDILSADGQSVLVKDVANHIHLKKKKRQGKVVFEIPSSYQGKEIVLQVEKPTNSKGQVFLKAIAPFFSGEVSTSLIPDNSSSLSYMADGNSDTFTRFKNQKTAGKSILITYKKAIKASAFTIISGAPRSTTNFIHKANVEVSSNGKDFTNCQASFNLGKVSIKTNGQVIKAIRLTFPSNHDEAIVIQDTQFKK